jgi:signal transduction histidine kinase/CheY-like chemotaxis protein
MMAGANLPPSGVDFQTLFQALPGLYLILKPDLSIVAATDAYLAATMTRRDEVLGRDIFEVFPANPATPDATGTDNLRASLLRALQRKAPDSIAVQRYDVRRPAGRGKGFEKRYWSAVNSPVLDSNGDVALLIHQVEDVTGYMHGKALEREKEQRLLEKAEHMEAEIFQRAQALQDTNEALRDSEARLQQLNDTLEQRVAERTQQLEEEIEERERTETALREAQKLEAVGRLAGGIAHDFNNLLTIVLGNVDLVREQVAPPGGRLIEAIEHAALQGTRLTRQLLTFTRRQALRPEIIDLASRSEGMTEFLARSLGGNIRIEVTFPRDLWPVECDLGEMELALINLCVNARDAMPDGGLVRIDARNVTLRGGEYPGAVFAGDFVALSVADNGTGIEPDVLAHVFEPFFTTKVIGKGSGLGLSQVHGFAQQAGGLATIESELDRGTTVTLLLPRSYVPAPPRSADDRQGMTRGIGMVLLVEDNDGVAETAMRMLDLIGYRSHWVQDAGTALALLLGGQRFDLVFSDIVMPGSLTGLDLARRIRRYFPAQPVLLATGYSDAAAEVAAEGFSILAKPYRANALADAIRTSLNIANRARRNIA